MKLAAACCALVIAASTARAQVIVPSAAGSRVVAVSAAGAQGGGASAEPARTQVEKPHPSAADAHAEGDFIMEHISDGHEIDIPWPNRDLMLRVQLPQWEPVQLGPIAVDLSPTKHVVMLLIACFLCVATLLTAARSHARRASEGKAPKGLANAIEAMVLYIRSEVILPNVGHHGEGFVPYLLTCFFFILFANLLGLVPYASTATSNIAVTAALAVVAFFVVEIAGMRTLGAGYIKTIVFWPHDMSLAMKLPLTLILTPVELIGKFTKPFALAIRLFANMTAGHIVILAMIGMVFTFHSIFIAPFPIGMAIAIMLLEILIGFIQAFVFTLLVSVFIGQLREGAH